jgi:hypothetical protein
MNCGDEIVLPHNYPKGDPIMKEQIVVTVVASLLCIGVAFAADKKTGDTGQNTTYSDKSVTDRTVKPPSPPPAGTWSCGDWYGRPCNDSNQGGGGQGGSQPSRGNRGPAQSY